MSQLVLKIFFLIPCNFYPRYHRFKVYAFSEIFGLPELCPHMGNCLGLAILSCGTSLLCQGFPEARRAVLQTRSPDHKNFAI